MVTFSWVDRNRRYLIVTRGYLEEGQAVSRQRWCQVVADVNANIQMVDLDIPQTVTVEIYYATFSDIDKEGMMISSWRRIQHGCALFVKWKTQMMRIGTAMPSLAENIFSSM